MHDWHEQAKRHASEIDASLRPALALPPLLLVEDDELIRLTTAMHLQDLGRTVVEAGDGAAALQSLAADPALTILIADLGLPDMDGVTLIARARELRPGLRVIVASGRDLQEPIEGTVPLQKPYNSEALQRALATV
jgi:CheY-like chemotaxis protein